MPTRREVGGGRLWREGSGNRRTALLILNLDARGCGVVNTTPFPICPWERATVPIEQEDGRAPGSPWTDVKSFEPQTVQYLASRCAEYVIPALWGTSISREITVQPNISSIIISISLSVSISISAAGARLLPPTPSSAEVIKRVQL